MFNNTITIMYIQPVPIPGHNINRVKIFLGKSFGTCMLSCRAHNDDDNVVVLIRDLVVSIRRFNLIFFFFFDRLQRGLRRKNKLSHISTIKQLRQHNLYFIRFLWRLHIICSR